MSGGDHVPSGEPPIRLPPLLQKKKYIPINIHPIPIDANKTAYNFESAETILMKHL